MAGANSLGIGVAHDWDFLHGNHLSGRVPPLFLLGDRVFLDLHRVIAAVGKSRGDCRNVGQEAIGGDLKALLGLRMLDSILFT